MPNWTQAQLDAINKSGTNIIVSAGAGSGKTAVLTERVIEKVKNGVHINELLILTFTKAAAAEMKARIRTKLSKYKNELNLLNSSYITTFDSYALSILKKYHYLLNIPKSIDITDESLIALEKVRIFDEIFDNLYAEENEDFEKLVRKYCVKKDTNLRKNIMDISLSIGLMFNKDEYIKYIEKSFFNDNNIENILSDYKEFLSNKKENIIIELENLSYYLNNNYVTKLNECLSSLLNSDIEDLYLISKVDFPRLTGASLEEKKLNEEFKGLVNDLLSYSRFGSFGDIKSSIINSKDDIYTIIGIVKRYLNELDKYKKENNIYTFNDIAMLSMKILNENESVREEVKNSFKEIMIDEYQDTNDVQEKFVSLISNNNVYMVGDIKQSIYRFRGSKPNIFKSKYDMYSKNNNGIKIDLLENFRSRSEVIEGINKIFSLIMDDDIGGADYKSTHMMKYGNKVYDNNKYKTDYNIEILEYDKDITKKFSDSEIEIFMIAKDIKEKINSSYQIFDKELNCMRNCKYSDFSIILDTSTSFVTYKRIFEYLGIPLSILRDENITNNTDISLIKNLFDIVVRINKNDFNNEFRFDFMSIGRSFIYEYDDEYLFEIMTQNNFKDTSLYKDLSSIKINSTKTCNDIFKSILEVTDIYNKIYKVGNYKEFNARISKLYELSLMYSSLGYGIYEFNEELSNLLDSKIEIKYTNEADNSDSVKILTIHASKGLEYPICYFASLDHKFNVNDLNSKIVVDSRYGIIIPNENNDVSLLKELYKNSYMKEEISEKIRLFYVALTRVREKMIIVIPYNDMIKANINEHGVINRISRLSIRKLSSFIYNIKEYNSDLFKKIDLKEIGLTKDYLNNKNNISSIKNVEDDISVEEISIKNEEVSSKHFSKESYKFISKDVQEKLDFGTKVHEILEYTDFKNYNPDLIKDEFIRNKVTNFIKSELLRNIKSAKIYKEFEFNYKENNILYNGIIDLMLEYNDHIDIIDYKLKNIEDEAYNNQLLGYKKYIEDISKKKVYVYLYSIIDEIAKEIKA